MNFSNAHRRGLLFQIVVTLLVVCAVNALIFAVNRPSMGAQDTPLLPPGYVIGAVWTGLFVCMAIARWILLGPKSRSWSLIDPISILAISSIIYPFYTGFLNNLYLGITGNIVTFGISVWAVWQVASRSRLAAALILPVSIWLAYATFATVQEVLA